VDGDSVMIIDLSDLAKPRQAAKIHRPGLNSDEDFTIYKEGNTLFVNDSNVLNVFDMSDVDNPVKKDSLLFEQEL